LGPFKEEGEENVKEEPDLVLPDAAAATAAAGPLISRAREEAALQSVLSQLHAAQRERMLVMELEEREKVRYLVPTEQCYWFRVRGGVSGSVPLAYGSGSLLPTLGTTFRSVQCKYSSLRKEIRPPCNFLFVKTFGLQKKQYFCLCELEKNIQEGNKRF
jgi:hypothetical protein